ncbi:MAG TPA: metallophosphoesterase family protein, partial [Minicystis sp.]|nr:metallophosphoesterase family protein [Minicystis sp.]
MKIGLLSDLHAAPGALEAALRELDREHVDAIAILGDIVGYHAEPEACVARVRSLGAVVVAGNHDRAAVSDAEPAGFSPRARSALAWTRRALSDEARAFLASLPTTARVGRALLVHAALSPEPNDTARITSPEL